MTVPGSVAGALQQDRSGPGGKTATGTSGRPASRWVVFAIVSIALFMSSLDGTIVATGLPTLRDALHTRINWASWAMTGYQLGLVVAMPIAGRIADQYGRKRVFLMAAALFTTASFVCGMSSNIEMLIGLRVLQAAGGAAFMPAASGIVVDIFGKDRNKALGMFSSIFPLGALVGPILGGVILTTWSWRGLFLVNVPIGVIFTILAVRYLPTSPRQDGRADLVGAFLLGGTILGLMLAITSLGDAGGRLGSVSFALPAAMAVVCGWLFLWRSARIERPLIPIYLLRGRAFAAVNLINLVWGACAIGFGALVPLFAEERYGLNPLAAGTLLTARAVGEVGVALCASLAINRTGYRLPMAGGFIVICGGFAMIASPPPLLGPYAWLALSAAVTGLGIGLSAPASNNASLELAPNDVGSITGLRGAARQGGAIIAVAVTTSVVAQSAQQAQTLGRSFVALAALLALMMPLLLVVPERRRRRPRKTSSISLQHQMAH